MQTKHGYKVKEDFVKERLIQTSELRFFEKKTKDKFLYSRLDLDYPENEEGNSKLITINDQDEKILAEFILGKEKKNGVYIKTIDGTETWLTNGLLQMPNEINQWLDTLILNIEYESIKKIKLEHADENILLISKKNKEDENFIIDNLPKGKIPKSDLIGNFLGYFFTNLFFEDVSDRKEINNNNLITKIRFDLFNDFFIEGAVFKENDSKWINFTIDQESSQKLFNEQKVLVENINEWSYKLQSTKYNTLDTKLKDLLVED